MLVQSNIHALLRAEVDNSFHRSATLASYVHTEHRELDFSHTLTVSGQALTPYMLRNVLLQLDELFVPESAAFNPFHQQFGDDVIEVRGKLLKAEPKLLNALCSSVSLSFNVDVAIQGKRPTLSRPGLLVMDMDSTVIAIECIDEIAKLAGVGDKVAQVTAKAMRGEIAFNDSLIHRVACLEDVSVAHLSQIRDSIPLMPGIQALLATLKQRGWKLAIASGGFTYFADHLKDRLGLDYAVSNLLCIEEGKLTGKVSGEIVNAEVKARTVNELAKQWDILGTQTVAMGDGANDLAMMEASALGVACHGKPLVNEKADVAIRVGSLHSLLYLLDA